MKKAKAAKTKPTKSTTVKRSKSDRLLVLQFPLRTLLGVIFTVVAIGCYGFGVFLPFMEVDKFWVFHNIVSLYSSIIILFKTSNYFLGIVIFVFSIIIPLAKFILLAYVSFLAKPAHARRALDLIERIGKWSMLDVFVVAIIVVSVKLGAIVNVKIHSGVIFFSVAIIVTALLIRYFNMLCRLAEEGRHQSFVQSLHLVKSEKKASSVG